MVEPKAIAVVGVGAILPDAPDVPTFWKNIQSSRYSIGDVTPDRWQEAFYYNPDASVPDKTYTKIGGWVHDFQFEPLKWGIPIPPKMMITMDQSQQWAITACRQALMDYGYPNRKLDNDRVAVIFGNAMAGENHYRTSLRIFLPEYVDALANSPAFQKLPEEMRGQMVQEMCSTIQGRIPSITEDTMPGELANIIAGRVANVFNFGGANFVTDAACASSFAALQAAVEGLISYKYDAVLTGGVDRNMGVESFVKFCKIGALSPDGSRPYSDGANGFVMGEGTAIFLLKRLDDAERDGDKIYAVVRGIGSSSDGKGKGITAPNPIGQQRAIERAWKESGVDPTSVGLIEGHGTSTKVGDVVEVNSLNVIFGNLGIPVGSVALGSVKSNIGHLKSAAGAAGMLKVVMALHDKILPPSANFQRPNPNIDFAHMPFAVNTQARPWPKPAGEVRRAGVSAFGFGGTNFHVVLEEYVPGLHADHNKVFPIAEPKTVAAPQPVREPATASAGPKPFRGVLFLGADSAAELKDRVNTALDQARSGSIPASGVPSAADLRKPERLAIDYADGAELVKRLEKTIKTFELNSSSAWQALTAQGVYRGSGVAAKVAFLFPGQGSQYANMFRELADLEPVVAETYREADAVMTPILGRPLTSYIFADGDEEAIKQAEVALKNTTITQPAVLTANVAMMRLLAKFGFKPDMVIGHSLGEYAALVAAGVLTFAEALEVVSARGREMSKISVADNGCMAAVSAPLNEVERILKTIDGYVVIANINSPLQCVIAGATAAVDASVAAFGQAGFQAVKIPVSHAFHTQIVAPASVPLRKIIDRMNVQMPRLPIAANVTGKLYPTTREAILDILADQVASPVQFIQGVETLYAEGARVFIEVGPKRVLNALATDILKGRNDVTILATNHPRKGALPSFNEALCGMYAAGVGAPSQASAVEAADAARPAASVQAPVDGRLPLTGSVVISGAGLGLPGRSNHIFSDQNVERILKGEMLIEPVAEERRQAIVDLKASRLEKSDAGAVMLEIDSLDKTIKLAGQGGAFDPVNEFGIPAERVDSWDISTQLAISAGIEALRDASIPLVMHYRRTSKGTFLPNRWMLPEAMADETGVIFASAFPGLERMAEELDSFYDHKRLLDKSAELKSVLDLLPADAGAARTALEARIADVEAQLAANNYHFDRRFVFRVLAMGHSQFAEYIGAKGPNTHVNAACATTTQAVALAEDWIRAGRCRRVVIISGDDISDGRLFNWVGTGMFVSGASSTEGDVRKAALPFDRRRNGLIIGMGAAALVVEAEDAVRERGVRGICEIIATQTANSAYHGTRLDVAHVASVMDRLLCQAEERFGVQRKAIAPQTVFMSHETYTPARGGSAAAEIAALRQNFGEVANRVVIANTKGFTGHSMGVGIEDVVVTKALEYGIVPPIAHYDDGFEPDPDLGDLNLSRGGKYPVQYALRLGAGFGSQIAMTLTRHIAGEGERVNRPVFNRWLADMVGAENAELEVVQRTLRIKQAGPPTRQPAASTWRFGQGPTLWASQPAANHPAADRPLDVQPQNQPQTTVQAAPAPQVSTPVAAAPASVDLDAIEKHVLSVVAEKTGYPAEMLDPDLDLEGDLGIDTVKQAELFRSIREHYGIPRREDLRLSDYNTLKKVVGFVSESLAASGAASQPVQSEPAPVAVLVATPTVDTPAVQAAGASDIQAYVLGLVSEKTGYPPEMLDLDLDLEGDLGIDTVKQAELFRAVREHYGIPRREDLRLAEYNTLTKVIQFVQDANGAAAEQPAAVAAAPAAAAPVPVAAPAAADTGDEEELKAYVLSVVSEKTGYPAEMLDLDLDLEGDLGIDTVKQAELFATIRTHYGIPRREDLRLSDYNTLAKVMQFMRESAGGQAAAPAVESAAPAAEAMAPVVEPVAAAPQAPAPAGDLDDEIRRTVLSVVAEKTGYPEEMLDLDLDLEGDLGIDTVKQAEIFATIRGHFDIPRREDLRLADYNTLAKVMGFMAEALQAKAQAAVPAPEPAAEVEAPQPAEEATAEPVEEREIRRRVPMPVLRPRLDLCLPTGISFGPESRVVIVADRGKVSDSLARRLRARKAQVLVVSEGPVDEITAQVSECLAAGPVQGVFYLPALDAEPAVRDHNLETWRSEQDRRLPVLAAVMRQLTAVSFLISATRMGGLHGYNANAANAPLCGLVTGFTKAIGRERSGCFVKAVDFSQDLAATTLAARLVDEALRDPGAMEIGWEGTQRYAITLVDRPYAAEPRFAVESGSVFLVSGGTGGITAPVVIDLAQQTQGTFYLVSRSTLPERTDADLVRVRTERDALRIELMTRKVEGQKKVTPAVVEARLAALERAAATWETIDAVQAAGGRAFYLSADVSDPQAVAGLVEKVLEAEGRVDVLVHAAGQDRSRKLENKPVEEFQQIVAVKADGLFYLFKALEERQRLPRAVVAFTSVAGRFGNSGQTDYSAANDLACKLIYAIGREYPDLRTIAIDWGAWSEVGMASRGHIPELMRMAGIEMISPAQAAPLVYRELVFGSGGEVVLAGALGALETSPDPSGGMDVEAANKALTEGEPVHVMLSRVTGLSLLEGVYLEAELDPGEPFLKDHAMNGIPLLPGVMGIEGFSVAARHVSSVLGSEKGGFRVGRLEDVSFLAPFKLYRGESRRITWKAQVVREDFGLVAAVTLESTLALRSRPDEVVRHFSGKVHLVPVQVAEDEATVAPPNWNGAYTVQSEDIYKLYFHGPSFQVLEGVQRSGEVVLGRLRRNLPDITADDAHLITTPVLLELCLQTAGVWEIGATGVMALPHSIGSLKIYKLRTNGEPIFAEVVPTQAEDGQMSFDARVVDAKGRLYLELSDYRTIQLPYTVEQDLLAPLKGLVEN